VTTIGPESTLRRIDRPNSDPYVPSGNGAADAPNSSDHWDQVAFSFSTCSPQDGREFTGRPLRDRRARLEIVVAGSEFVLPVRRLAKNGFEAWSEVIGRDYEGLVAKDEASLSEAGPTRRWLKVKQRGWTDAEDRWQRRISVRAER
jgi:hypothetical protein